MSAHSLRPKVTKYRVVKGDSLWMIAAREYGDPTVWPEISKANQLPNPDLILVGMSLHLPTVRRYSAHNDSHRLPVGIVPLQQSLPASSQPLGVPVPPTAVPVPRGGARVPQPTGTSLVTPQTGRGGHLVRTGNRPAVQVLFPAVKYKLDDFAPLIVDTPAAVFSLRFIGEVSLQQKGTMSEIELSQRGTLSEKLKAEYKSKLADLAGQVKIGFNSQTREVQISCGFSVAAKLDGQVFATSQYDFIPPNRLKYSYKPKPIQGEWQGLVFTGSVGFELEVMLKKPDSRPPVEPLPVPEPQRVPTWVWVAAGALVVAGAVIIVADIAKDVGTLGIGTVESPLSFAAASALFAEAGSMVQ